MNNKKWWLFLVLAVIAVTGLILSSCGPSTTNTPAPTGTPTQWVPDVPGMKYEERDLNFNWLWGDPSAKIADTDWKTWFTEEWTKRTNGHMKVTMRYAGQLGSAVEAPGLVASGVVPIMYCSPSYHIAEMPLTQVSIIPFMATSLDNPEQGMFDSAVIQHAIHLHPLAKREFARLNLIMINHLGQQPSYNLEVRMGKKLNYDANGYLTDGLNQFKGLILRSPGYYAVIAKELGMGTVLVTAGEHYEGMQKGLMDINPLGISSLMSQKIWEVTDRWCQTAIGWGSAGEIANLETWNKLPQYIRDVHSALIPEANNKSRTLAIAYHEKVLNFLKDKGVPSFKITDEGWKQFHVATAKAYDEWRTHCIKMYNGDAKVFNEYFTDIIRIRNDIAGKHGEPKWDIFMPAGLGDVSKPYPYVEAWYKDFYKTVPKNPNFP